jgi:hypothetical protein
MYVLMGTRINDKSTQEEKGKEESAELSNNKN